MKRTTGIPRSFLKTVEKPAALSNDGTTDDTKPPSGVMVNAEGEFVIAEPDKASWEQFQAKTKSSAALQKAAALGDKELQDRGLECSIDKKLFIDPMKTPCCEKTYCNDCITNALIESDFTCPGCQTDGVLIDDLKPDDETSTKITAYLSEKNAADRKEKKRSRSPSDDGNGGSGKKSRSATPAAVPEVKVKDKSPSPKKSPKVQTASTAKGSPKQNGANTPTSTTTPTVKNEPLKGKKRPADELLENPKIPKGPKAMQQQEAQKQALLKQQQQQAMMNAMPGFPNMPFDMSQQFYGNGFNNMPNMGMINPLFNMGMPPISPMGMNPMMMNGYGSYPNMNGMNMYGAGNYGGGMGNGGNMGMMNGLGRGNAQMNGANGNGATTGFPNQQKTVFAEPLPNEEDNAYFRKPVNPHRHVGRQRRARPSDYREL